MEPNKNKSLLSFIGTSSFEEIKLKVSQPPYNLVVVDEGPLYLLKYNPTKSDFSFQVVREARGVILEKDTNLVVCRPFDKFFNVGEPYAAQIDWGTARIQQKVDGSLIKMFWYDREWRVATNGTINAFTAPLQDNMSPYKTFGDLFHAAVSRFYHGYLDKNFTYMFELVSPYNRVVVPYKEPAIYLIGIRNNRYGEEIPSKTVGFRMGLNTPITYVFGSMEDVIEMAKKLPFDEEGYVVVDGNFNRVKVKSAAYVIAHHLKNNGVITTNNVLEMIMTGEDSEFISYYPEYGEWFSAVTDALNKYKSDLNSCQEEMDHLSFANRKEFASWAKKHEDPPFLFLVYDCKIINSDDYLSRMPTGKLSEVLCKRYMEV
jgi:hypothetical protein